MPIVLRPITDRSAPRDAWLCGLVAAMEDVSGFNTPCPDQLIEAVLDQLRQPTPQNLSIH